MQQGGVTLNWLGLLALRYGISTVETAYSYPVRWARKFHGRFMLHVFLSYFVLFFPQPPALASSHSPKPSTHVEPLRSATISRQILLWGQQTVTVSFESSELRKHHEPDMRIGVPHHPHQRCAIHTSSIIVITHKLSIRISFLSRIPPSTATRSASLGPSHSHHLSTQRKSPPARHLFCTAADALTLDCRFLLCHAPITYRHLPLHASCTYYIFADFMWSW